MEISAPAVRKEEESTAELTLELGHRLCGLRNATDGQSLPSFFPFIQWLPMFIAIAGEFSYDPGDRIFIAAISTILVIIALHRFWFNFGLPEISFNVGRFPCARKCVESLIFIVCCLDK